MLLSCLFFLIRLIVIVPTPFNSAKLDAHRDWQSFLADIIADLNKVEKSTFSYWLPETKAPIAKSEKTADGENRIALAKFRFDHPESP